MTRQRSKFEYPFVVPNPRYGDSSIVSDEEVGLEEIRQSHWRYAYSAAVMPDLSIRPGKESGHRFSSEFIFIASAVRADVERQRHGGIPRQYYVDTLKICQDCGEHFIFFALEQRHWYEVLGFWIKSECVRCSVCRLSERRIRTARQRFTLRTSEIDNLDARQFDTLLRDALLLAESGILKDLSKLRRLRNIAIEKGGAYKSLPSISEFLKVKA